MVLFGCFYSSHLFLLVLLCKDVRIVPVCVGAVAFVTMSCCAFLLLRYCYTLIAKIQVMPHQQMNVFSQLLPLL